ncbi:hypothetical protein CCP3SC1AL1_1190011 [Gammaproteobacteria bacterium]
MTAHLLSSAGTLPAPPTEMRLTANYGALSPATRYTNPPISCRVELRYQGPW